MYQRSRLWPIPSGVGSMPPIRLLTPVYERLNVRKTYGASVEMIGWISW